MRIIQVVRMLVHESVKQDEIKEKWNDCRLKILQIQKDKRNLIKSMKTSYP